MESESLTIEGLHVSAYQQTEPNKKAILFVHGAWHAGWYWEVKFIPFFFEKGYSCYALDLREH